MAERATILRLRSAGVGEEEASAMMAQASGESGGAGVSKQHGLEIDGAGGLTTPAGAVAAGSFGSDQNSHLEDN